MASRSNASTVLSTGCLGPGRMARPSAWSRASRSASSRSSVSARLEGAELVSHFFQFSGVFAQTRPLKGRSSGGKRPQFVCRDGNEAAQCVRAQPPVLPAIVAVRLFQWAECPLDGVAKTLSRSAADRELRLDVGKRHAETRALEADRQSDNVLQTFVAHPVTLRSTREPRRHDNVALGTGKAYARKPMTCGWPGLASHSSRNIRANASGSPSRPRISALRRTVAKSPGASTARSRRYAGGSIRK